MAAGQFYQGKNLRISLEGNTLFHATSATLSIQSDVDEVATKDTSGKVLIPGSYSGSISLDNLLADIEVGAVNQVDHSTLLGYQLAKTEITWEFTTGVSGDLLVSGTGYLVGSDLTAETEGIGTGSFSIQTTGDITVTTVA